MPEPKTASTATPRSNDMDPETLAWFREQQRQSRVNRLKNSGISPAYVDGELTTRSYLPPGGPTTEQERDEMIAIVAVEEWAKGLSRDPFLFLYGDVGLGKSHLAQAGLACALTRREKASGRFSTFGSILEDVRASYDQAGITEQAVVDRYRQPTFLVIDDVGASDKPSEFSLRVLFQIINHRIEYRLRTLLTSNYSLADLGERITPPDLSPIEAARVLDRIVGAGPIIKLRGDSYRGRNRLD
jgi:primosomal protein DnaI